jgi:hypothetical protein
VRDVLVNSVRGELKFRRTGALPLMASLKRHDRSFVRESFGPPPSVTCLDIVPTYALALLNDRRIARALLDVAPVEQTQNIEDKIATGTNPPGLSFVLTTRNGRKPFHLGEMIEMCWFSLKWKEGALR